MRRKFTAGLIAIMMMTSISPTLLASDYEGHWASAAIDRWKDRGIIEGFGDGTFRPKEQITRSQFAKIMVELFGYSDTTGSKQYTDVASNRWYSDYVRKISAAGIMYDNSNTFRPDEPITREETAYALANAYKLSTTRVGTKMFTDEYSIATWALDEVKALHDAGYIQGLPNGSFNPKGLLTRAEFITMIDRMNADVINEKGTYRNNVSGNLVVNTQDVNLKNMTIYGNLYLAEGIGAGDIRLENVIVKGTTYIEGGGINSIRSNDSTYEGNIKVSAKNPVRIVNEGKDADIELLEDTEVTLTGSFDDVTVYPNVDLTVRDARIDKIYITDARGSNADIEIRSDSRVTTIEADKGVTITGSGTVKELIANVDGVKISKRPDKLTLAKNVTVSVAGRTQSSSSSSRPNRYYDDDYMISGRIYIDRNGEREAADDATIRIYEDDRSSAYKRASTNSRGYYEIMLPEDVIFRMEVSYTDRDGRTYRGSKYIGRLYDDERLDDIILRLDAETYRVSGTAYIETNSTIATGATIRVYSGNNTTPTNSVTTNANGEFSVSLPANQTYRIEGTYTDNENNEYHYRGNISKLESNQTLEAIYLKRVPNIQVNTGQ